MTLNLWKDIRTGPSVPKVVYAVIEIPKGSRNKYEYDEDNGVFKLDRVLYSPLGYPADYGIIPRTGMGDGNPMDILVITDQPTFPGCIIECRPIGMLSMTDENSRDDKIIGVSVKEPKFQDFRDIQDIPVAFLEEVEHFFKEYKKLEEKYTEVIRWKNAKRAFETIEYSLKVYYTILSMKSLFYIK